VACRVFRLMQSMNVVSWSALISGFVQNGRADEALDLFRDATYADALPYCTQIPIFNKDS
jgi:pentatricopeptide repeat protein